MARQKELSLFGGFQGEYYTIKIEYCQLLDLVIKLESFFFFLFLSLLRRFFLLCLPV